MKTDQSTLDILRSAEVDIRTIGALTQAIKLLVTGVDTVVPSDVVDELGRLAEEAAKRIEEAWHNADVALCGERTSR